MRTALVSLALVLGAGCGALNSTGSCDFRAKQSRCQEREALATSLVAFEQLCKTSGGVYSSGACPREGILGGCDLSEVANPVRDWYYTSAAAGLSTSADVMKKCEGKAYLTP